MSQHESGANSPFVRHEERKRESTMQTVVVKINKEPFDIYIGRAGRGEEGYFGNPFRMRNGISREDAVQKFQKYFTERIEKDSEFRR
jgi:RNA binding exosome subunit